MSYFNSEERKIEMKKNVFDEMLKSSSLLPNDHGALVPI